MRASFPSDTSESQEIRSRTAPGRPMVMSGTQDSVLEEGRACATEPHAPHVGSPRRPASPDPDLAYLNDVKNWVVAMIRTSTINAQTRDDCIWRKFLEHYWTLEERDRHYLFHDTSRRQADTSDDMDLPSEPLDLHATNGDVGEVTFSPTPTLYRFLEGPALSSIVGYGRSLAIEPRFFAEHILLTPPLDYDLALKPGHGRYLHLGVSLHGPDPLINFAIDTPRQSPWVTRPAEVPRVLVANKTRSVRPLALVSLYAIQPTGSGIKPHDAGYRWLVLENSGRSKHSPRPSFSSLMMFLIGVLFDLVPLVPQLPRQEFRMPTAITENDGWSALLPDKPQKWFYRSVPYFLRPFERSLELLSRQESPRGSEHCAAAPYLMSNAGDDYTNDCRQMEMRNLMRTWLGRPGQRHVLDLADRVLGAKESSVRVKLNVIRGICMLLNLEAFRLTMEFLDVQKTKLASKAIDPQGDDMRQLSACRTLTKQLQGHIHVVFRRLAGNKEALDWANQAETEKSNQVRSAGQRPTDAPNHEGKDKAPDLAADDQTAATCSTSTLQHGQGPQTGMNVDAKTSISSKSDDSNPLGAHIGSEQQHSLVKDYEDISTDLQTLDKDFAEIFTLMIGGIQMKDSEVNKTQAQRSTFLAAIAAVYLPMTLATGVFGMNVTLIDGTDWRWPIYLWLMFFVPLLVIFAWLWRRDIARWFS